MAFNYNELRHHSNVIIPVAMLMGILQLTGMSLAPVDLLIWTIVFMGLNAWFGKPDNGNGAVQVVRRRQGTSSSSNRKGRSKTSTVPTLPSSESPDSESASDSSAILDDDCRTPARRVRPSGSYSELTPPSTPIPAPKRASVRTTVRKFEEEFLARNNTNNRAAKKLDRDTSSKRGNSQPVQEPQSTNGPHDLSDDDTRLRDTVATSDSWREALALLKTIQEDKIHDDTYKIIVSRITSDGHPEEALDVVESMHRNGRSDKATKACYVAMIDECTTSKKYQVSLDILQCMRDKGHAIEASVYNPIIGACNNSREGATSLKLIEDMAREKVMPSLVSVNTTICALGRSGQWEDSVALLQKVEKQFGLKPDIVSYNTAIAGCVPARQWALALELITQAETDCTPNAITYNSCLSACGAAKEWELALALMERMKNNGVNPNARTYGAAIMACKVSRRWRETRTLFKQMIAEGLCPDAQAYSHVIAVACGIRQWKDALSMLRAMASNGLRPDASVYNRVATVVLMSRQWREGLELLTEMKGLRFSADDITRKTIHVCPDQDMAAELHAAMGQN